MKILAHLPVSFGGPDYLQWLAGSEHEIVFDVETGADADVVITSLAGLTTKPAVSAPVAVVLLPGETLPPTCRPGSVSLCIQTALPVTLEPCLNVYLDRRVVTHFGVEAALLSIASHHQSRVWAVASEEHYADHVVPQLHAVHPFRRGGVIVPRTSDRRVFHLDVWSRVLRAGLPVATLPAIKHRSHLQDFLTWLRITDVAGSICLCVSQRDYQLANELFRGRVVRGEHGAGQSYTGVKHHSFAGGPGHANCLSATAPNAQVAARIRESNPAIQVAEIGCPRLLALAQCLAQHTHPKSTDKPRVAFSFRYTNAEDAQVPELASAWEEYAPWLTTVSQHFHIGLHCHPRFVQRNPGALQLAEKNGWARLPEVWDLLTWADVFAVDNSSIAVEWLTLRGNRLVLLDSKHYRRWINHGLRFWELEKAGGVTSCSTPTSLQTALEAALQNKNQSPPDFWYAPADPARLGRWLVGHLRPPGEMVQVDVLQSHDGKAGRLRAGQQGVWLQAEHAQSLKEKRLVVARNPRPEPKVPSLGRPELEATWDGVLAQQAFSWYVPEVASV